VITLGMDVLYVLILQSEGEGDLYRARPQLIAMSLAASAAVALGGRLVREPRLRLALLAAAAFAITAGAGVSALVLVGTILTTTS